MTERIQNHYTTVLAAVASWSRPRPAAPSDPASGSRTGGALLRLGEGVAESAGLVVGYGAFQGGCSPVWWCDPLSCAHLESSTVAHAAGLSRISCLRGPRPVVPLDPDPRLATVVKK
ncbi:MAG: hypothetical protein ACYDEY_13400 [Acidimicrobiales bacterium]